VRKSGATRINAATTKLIRVSRRARAWTQHAQVVSVPSGFPNRLTAAAALSILAAGACAHHGPVAPAAPAPPEYACTLLIGLGVTSEWFTADFERAVGDAQWQAMFRKGTFVQDWADPAHDAWSEPIVSACSRNAQAPDRVVFVAANWDFKTVDEWLEPLRRLVETIKSKHPSAKRIELMTVVRPPGNVSCGGAKSAVAPIIDEAIAEVSGSFPGLVQAAPKFELPSCDAFTKGGPHFTPEGGAQAARIIAAHYGKPVLD
jgi:hypothetical protein